IVGLIPIFFNNLGAREGIYTLLLGLLGLPAAQALALALLVFGARLVVSLLGGVVLLLESAVEVELKVTSDEGRVDSLNSSLVTHHSLRINEANPLHSRSAPRAYSAGRYAAAVSALRGVCPRRAAAVRRKRLLARRALVRDRRYQQRHSRSMDSRAGNLVGA